MALLLEAGGTEPLEPRLSGEDPGFVFYALPRVRLRLEGSGSVDISPATIEERLGGVRRLLDDAQRLMSHWQDRDFSSPEFQVLEELTRSRRTQDRLAALRAEEDERGRKERYRAMVLRFCANWCRYLRSNYFATAGGAAAPAGPGGGAPGGNTAEAPVIDPINFAVTARSWFDEIRKSDQTAEEGLRLYQRLKECYVNTDKTTRLMFSGGRGKGTNAWVINKAANEGRRFGPGDDLELAPVLVDVPVGREGQFHACAELFAAIPVPSDAGKASAGGPTNYFYIPLYFVQSAVFYKLVPKSEGAKPRKPGQAACYFMLVPEMLLEVTRKTLEARGFACRASDKTGEPGRPGYMTRGEENDLGLDRRGAGEPRLGPGFWDETIKEKQEGRNRAREQQEEQLMACIVLGTICHSALLSLRAYKRDVAAWREGERKFYMVCGVSYYTLYNLASHCVVPGGRGAVAPRDGADVMLWETYERKKAERAAKVARAAEEAGGAAGAGAGADPRATVDQEALEEERQEVFRQDEPEELGLCFHPYYTTGRPGGGRGERHLRYCIVSDLLPEVE